MKRIVNSLAVAAVALSIVTTPSRAIDIQGKWGLGALISTDRGTVETSLIRGWSNRGAIVIDASYFGSSSRLGGTLSSLQENQSFAVGPRLRRFTRTDAEFSPYVDLFAHAVGQVSLNSNSSGFQNDTRGWGGEAGLSLGMEYLTRWHFSLALQTNVATFSYMKTHETSTPGVSGDGSLWRASAGFSPQLFIRGYF